MERKCSKCKTVKPLTEFPNNKSLLLGKGYLCKPCEWKRRRTPEWRASSRKAAKKYLSSKKGKKYITAYNKSRPKKKLIARWRIQDAVKRRKVKPLPCEVCGSPKVDAHHDDYDKPLEVRWLCRQHHKEVHEQK